MTDRNSEDAAWGGQTRRPIAKKPSTIAVVGLVAGIAMLLSAGYARSASAETVAVAADATVANGQPNEARGGLSTLQVGASGKTRVVVRFDQADLATAVDGGVLQTARLELFITFNQNNWTPEGRPVDVSRLTGAWNESTVTWNCADDLDTSNNQADCTPEWDGGTYATEPTDVVIHDNGMTGWVSWDVTADVAAFLQGTPNHGWVIHKNDEARNGRADYGSREGATGQAPRLILTVATATATVTPLTTGTVTPSATPLPPSPSPSDTPTATPTHTDTPTATPTATDTPTITPTSTPTSTPTPDTVAPVITIVSPPDGLVTNQAAQSIAGTLDEPATLTINGDPVAVQPDLTFSAPVTLVEGPNVYSFVATDPFANAGSASHNLTLDTAAPAAIEGFQLSDLAPGDGIAVSAPPGTVDAGSTLEVTNTRTGQVVTVAVDANGSFTAPSVTAVMDDVFAIVVIDAAGNRSTATEAIAGPPDPAVVAPPVDRTVASAMIDTVSFLYAGDDPVQVGLTEPIEAERIAVLRGEVTDRDGNPLRAVKISVLDHPEYGHTRTRNDGMFDMVVNGGGTLTLVYEEAGRFPVQRTVTVPWQDTAQLPHVAMIAPDPVVTSVALSPSASLQVAVGSVETDSSGSRQAVLMFPAGVGAEIVDPQGNRTAVSSLDVRVTEYTVGDLGPEAMPGELPPASGYTYAFELSADGVDPQNRVELDQPVAFYVENFIGFPVGDTVPNGSGPMRVPLGYYDREAAQWVAADNGLVMALVGESGGVAQIDVDGDGDADSSDETILTEFGVSTAERIELAGRYPTGGQDPTTLWRATMTFFSRWDCNWPGGAPLDAIAPNAAPPSGGVGRERLDDPDLSGDGGIDFQNQALRRSVDVVGTPFTLDYQSNRQLESAVLNPLIIPVTGDNLPASLERVEVVIEVGGRTEVLSFPPLPNQETVFTWDGRDVYGRLLQGRQPVAIRVQYVYRRTLEEPFQGPQAFAQVSGGQIQGFTNTRSEIVSGREFRSFVGGWDARDQGLGGWSLNVHKSYDPVTRQVAGGDSTQRTAEQIGSVVQTAIGGGAVQIPVDGVTLARDLALDSIKGVAVDAGGRVYVAQVPALATGQRIFRVNEDGTVTTIAGGGTSLSEGIPATQAKIQPRGIAFGPDGRLYVADYPGAGSDPHRVRRIDLTATPPVIETVAGAGPQCGNNNTGAQCGDGGPALAALLHRPENVRVASDGTMYVSDRTRRIRRIGPDGIIRTIAGEGNAITEGEPSTGAGFFNSFIDMAIAEDGTLYVSGGGAKVHRIDTGGRIYTAAGSGVFADEGDGGLATSAQFFSPGGLAIGRDGSLYVSDTSYDRVRSVGPNGVITALAGRRVPLNSTGIDGENGPALAARFNQPNRLAVAPDGTLYIADEGNNRIRKVTPPLPGLSEVGDTIIASPDGSELYVFNPRGRHERTVDTLVRNQIGDPLVLFEFTYDAEGRLTAVTDRDDNTTTFERGVAAGDLVITGPFGQETIITLDANGYTQSIQRPGGETTSFAYTADGLMTSYTDPNTNQTTYGYGMTGKLESVVDPVGGSDTLARIEIAADADTQGGFQVAHTANEGVQTFYEVEFQSTGDERRTTLLPDGSVRTIVIGADQSETVTEPDGTVRNAALGPDKRFGMQAPVVANATITTPVDGLVGTLSTTQVVDPVDPLQLTSQTEIINGRTKTVTYDAATGTTTETTPGGRSIRTGVNAAGRPIQFQFGDLSPTDLTYDPVELRVSTITQGSRVSSITYDAAGNIATVTDPTGRSVAFTYDSIGRVLSQAIAGSAVTGAGYDEAGNVTSITPPGRPAHEFAYDTGDRPTQYIPPNTTPPLADSRTFLDYHLSGQLARIIRPDGQILFHDYDLETGDLTVEVQPTGQRSFSYDDLTGKLERIVSPAGTIAYAFDGSLLKSETWSGAVAGSVGRTYDSLLRVGAKSVNGGDAVAYLYDLDDLVVTISGTGGGGHSFTIDRDPDTGFVTATTLGVVTDTYTYDGFGAPTHYEARVGGTPVFSVDYTYDALGRIATRTESVEGVATSYAYGYDLAGRLADVATNAVVTAHYEYDPNGNRVAGFSAASGSVTAVYDDQDRLTGAVVDGTTVDFTYTANGELLTKTAGSAQTTYTYDLIGNLLAVDPPSGPLIEYVVDGNNRRIGRKEDAALVAGLLYDGRLAPIAQLDPSGAVVARFVHALYATTPDYLLRGGAVYRVVSDHLGSPRLVVDTVTGEIVQRTDYDEFGNIVFEDVAPGFERLPVGYAGGLRDDATGLLRFGARDYDPTTGRWTAKDPIGFSGGDANLYAYVAGDPINATDPTGLTADYSIAGLSASQEQSSYLKKTDFVRAQNRYKQLRQTACNFLDKIDRKSHKHHPIPEFTGPFASSADQIFQLDSFVHISILHPLLNIVARMSGLPSTYAGALSRYPDLLKNNKANQQKFAEALLITTKVVDSQCGTSVTEKTREALERLGWL